MDQIDEIRRTLVLVLEKTEDAHEQAVAAQAPNLPDTDRLTAIIGLRTILDAAMGHCHQAEADLRNYLKNSSK